MEENYFNNMKHSQENVFKFRLGLDTLLMINHFGLCLGSNLILIHLEQFTTTICFFNISVSPPPYYICHLPILSNYMHAFTWLLPSIFEFWCQKHISCQSAVLASMLLVFPTRTYHFSTFQIFHQKSWTAIES